jgi:hypothetical protein
MKRIIKTIFYLGVLFSSSLSFAQSQSSSCTAPTLNVVLGNIDFYQSSNYPLSTYKKLVDVTVSCTSPDQAWQILPYLKTLQINGGTINSNNGSPGISTTVYASFTSTTAQVPGTVFDQNSPISGTGTQSLVAQVVFGSNLPVGATPDAVNYTLTTGGTPYGPIELRGQLSLDIPLIIMY